MNQLIRGYWVTQAIYVVAELGVADLLVNGPKAAAELAEATGANSDLLYRVLRALAVQLISVSPVQNRDLSPCPMRAHKILYGSWHGSPGLPGRQSLS